MELAPCATCGCKDLDVRVVQQTYNNSQTPPDNVRTLFHVICRGCYQEWVE